MKTRVNWTIEKNAYALLRAAQTEAKRQGHTKSLSDLVEEAIKNTYTDPLTAITERKRLLAREITLLTERETIIKEAMK